MRPINELLELLLNNKSSFRYGLCSWVSNLKYRNILSRQEGALLLDYIDNNRPSKWSSIDAFIHRNKGFFWKEGDINPRIKWIKKHIKLNSTNIGQG